MSDELDVGNQEEQEVVNESDTKQENVTIEEKKSKVKELDQSEDLTSQFMDILSNERKFELNSDNKTIISTGLDVLDAVLGGGVGANFIQIVGNPGSGKTTLAIKILANAQKQYKRFIGVCFDSEQTSSKERLIELGVNRPPINPIDEFTVESIFKSIDNLCSFKYKNDLTEIPSIVLWDSIANTLTEKGTEAENVDKVIGEKARVFSAMLPKITQALNKFNICLLSVNQLREKIDMGVFKTPSTLRYLANSAIPGGRAILFNCFQLLLVRHVKDVDEYGFRGAIVEAKTVKNKLFTPNVSCNLVLSFTHGFSNFWTNYEFLKSTKRIAASAWCKLINYPEKKFRQVDAIKFYREDPKFKESWDELLKDAIQKEIIEANKAGSIDQIEVL